MKPVNLFLLGVIVGVAVVGAGYLVRENVLAPESRVSALERSVKDRLRGSDEVDCRRISRKVNYKCIAFDSSDLKEVWYVQLLDDGCWTAKASPNGLTFTRRGEGEYRDRYHRKGCLD